MKQERQTTIIEVNRLELALAFGMGYELDSPSSYI